MTPVERHAELIYAETLFEKVHIPYFSYLKQICKWLYYSASQALLGIVYSGDWLAFIKEAYVFPFHVHPYLNSIFHGRPSFGYLNDTGSTYVPHLRHIAFYTSTSSPLTRKRANAGKDPKIHLSTWTSVQVYNSVPD